MDSGLVEHPPAVAVIIPCRNHARYLPATIASVVGQTFHDWEIVIVDNGSTDDTAQVARRLIARFAPRRIQMISQAALGPGAGRNAGARVTCGRYLLPLDADDMLDAHFLERTVPVLEADPQLGFVTTNVRFFGAEVGQWSGGDPSRERMLFDSRATVTALTRRVAWEQVGGFSEQRDWQRYEDWDFWLRLAEQGWRGALVPELLFWYRRRAGTNLAVSQRDDVIYRARLILDHAGMYPESLVRWAGVVQQDVADGRRRDWYWLSMYALVIARCAPRELPKTLFRPAFKALGPHPQMYARRLAQGLGLSRKH